MGREIRFTKLALQDLDEIDEFISRDSPIMAKRWISKLMGIVGLIATRPEAGKMVPEFANPKVKQMVKGKYRIIYRNYKTHLTILRVLHSARLL